MFPGRYFASRYFADRYWAKVGANIVTSAVPGVEYTVRDNRPHFTVADSRCHYTLKDNRPHYQSRGTDAS